VVDASPAKLTVNIEIEVVGQLFVRLNNDVLLFVGEVERVQDCPNSRTMFIGFNPRLLNSAFDMLFLELSPLSIGFSHTRFHGLQLALGMTPELAS